MLAAILLLLSLAALTASESPCTVPVGIDDAVPGAANSSAFAQLPVDGIVLSLAQRAVPALSGASTPIQFQRAFLAGLPVYGAVAAFHPTALDFFGRVEESTERRRCTSGLSQPLLALHRRVTLAYAFLFASQAAAPASTSALDALVKDWGLDPKRCPGRPGCETTATPWGLGWALSADTRFLLTSDGWNANGTHSPSLVPYADWRQPPYRPQNAPWRLEHPWRWQPLPVVDKWGGTRYEDHTVPHAGTVGRSYMLGPKGQCELRAPSPRYDLEAEARRVAARVAELTESEVAAVGLFDGKFGSLFTLEFETFQRRNMSLDSFDGAKADLIVVAAMYEGVLATWKEKIRFDVVRPMSLIRAGFAGRRVPKRGGGLIDATAWEPVIPTMAHAEYPSLSACFCGIFSRVMELITGTDDVRAGTNGKPLVLMRPVPTGSVRFSFDKFSEVAAMCSKSRLDGGLHFEDAVTAGEELCRPIADIVFENFVELEKGVRPEGLARLDDPVVERKC